MSSHYGSVDFKERRGMWEEGTERQVDGCFTGKERGSRKKYSARVCRGEMDKDRKLVWYCQFAQNIKDMKLNKGGHESGSRIREEQGIEIGEGKVWTPEWEGTRDETLPGLREMFQV